MARYVDIESGEITEGEDLAGGYVPYADAVPVWHTEEQKGRLTSPTDAVDGIMDGRYLPQKMTEYDIYDGENEATARKATGEELYKELQAGKPVKILAPTSATNIYNEMKYGTTSEMLKTGVTEGLSGATFGIADPVLKEAEETITGKNELFGEERAKRAQANPKTAFLSGLGGGVATSALLPGSRIFKVFPNDGVFRAITKAMGGNLIDNAVIEGAKRIVDEAGNYVRENEDYSAQSYFDNVFKNTLYSAPFVLGAQAVNAPFRYAKGKMDKLKEADAKLLQSAADDIQIGDQVFVPSNINPSQLTPERSPHRPDKLGYRFKLNPEKPSEYVYNDGQRVVALDINNLEKANENIIRRENFLFQDIFTNPTPEGASYNPLAKDAKNVYKGLAIIDSANFPSETLETISNQKEFKKLAKLITDRANLSEAMTQAGDELAIKNVASNANNTQKEILKELNLLSKSKDPAVKRMASAIKNSEEKILSNANDRIASLLDSKIGHIDGDNLILYGANNIPSEAITLKAIKKPQGKYLKDIGSKMDSALKYFGGTSNQIADFKRKFGNLEDKQFAENFIKEVLSEDKRNFGLTAPSSQEIAERLSRRHTDAIQQRSNALNEMGTFLNSQGRVRPLDELDGRFIAKELNNIMSTFVNPVTGMVEPDKTKAIADLMSSIESFQARGYKMTPKEWIDTRVILDNLTEYTRADAPLKPASKAFKSVRDMMEDRLVKYVTKHSQSKPEAKAALKSYQDAKKIIRLTDVDIDGSLGKMAQRKLSLEGSRPLIGRLELIAGATGAMVDPIVGLGGIALSQARHTIAENAPYLKYKAYEKVIPAVANTEGRINKTARAFSKGLKIGAVPVAQASTKREKQADFYEKKQVELEEALKDPQTYIKNFMDSHPELGTDQMFLQKLAMMNYKATAFLLDKLPKNPYPTNSKINWKPSVVESSKWKRYAKAVGDVNSILDSVQQGNLSAEQVEVFQEIYPEVHQRLKGEIIKEMKGRRPTIQENSLFKRLYGEDLGIKTPAMRQPQAVEGQGKSLDQIGEMSLQEKTHNERILNR